jgi:hypothetical protein
VNPEQQRIAIAEACGWVREFDGNYEEPEWYWIPPNDPDGDSELPDYCNDLNAMHEAENVLTNEQWWLFVEFLTEIRGGGVALCISATAAQRAEAFLKTLNLWKQ